MHTEGKMRAGFCERTGGGVRLGWYSKGFYPLKGRITRDEHLKTWQEKNADSVLSRFAYHSMCNTNSFAARDLRGSPRKGFF